jgi:hypothetical protein
MWRTFGITHHWSRVLAILVLLLASVTAFAVDTKRELEQRLAVLVERTAMSKEDAEAWFDRGVVEHTLTLVYGASLSKDAVTSFATSYSLKKDPVTMAYLGSAWTLIGRDSKNPIEKIDGVMKGCEFLDAAVKEAPDNLVVRRIRYENNIALPDIFERGQLVEADVDYLLRVYSKDAKAFEGLYDPAHVFLTKARLLGWAGDWRKAQQYAQLGLKIAVDPEVKQQLQDFLDGKEPKQ